MGLLFEREGNPQNIHFECALTGRVEIARMRRAVVIALAALPRLRGRLHGGASPEAEWLLVGQSVEVGVATAPTSEDVDRVRRQWMERPFDVSREVVRLAILGETAGDTLLFSVHHAICDGVGVVRFASAVLEAYSGVEPAESPAARFGSARVDRPLLRLRPLLRHVRRTTLARQASIAATGHGQGADEFYVMSLGAEVLESMRVVRRRAGSPATLNDVLIAVLHLAVQRWNDAHSHATQTVVIVAPVNVRPQDRWLEPVGNGSSALATATSPEERRELVAAVASVAAQTSSFKTERTANAMFWLLNGLPRPRGNLRRVARWLAARSGGTLIVSNLGDLERAGVPDSSSGMRVARVAFSPPMPTHCGLAVGVVIGNDAATLTFRYRPVQFAPGDAARFASLFVAVVADAASARGVDHLT